MSDIRLVVKSEYGDVVAVLTNGTERAALLALTYDEERQGGPVDATFYLREGCGIPLYTGMNILIQKDGVDVALFDIDGNPDNRGTDGQIEVKCVGLGERLKKVYVTKTITSKTLKAACLDLASKALTVGIVIDTAYIDLPTDVTITSLELDDAALYDVIEDLLIYANGSASVDKYAWKIDSEKRLVIYDASALPSVSLYEGYGFQNPSSEVSHGDQINTIHLWRKTLDESTTEYVGEYIDDASVDKYGIFEKRIELGYYASSADCAVIADGILSRYAAPSRTISVSSMPQAVTMGPHRLFLKPRLVWERLYAGEDKDRLDLAHASGTSYADDASSLVGLLSTKCTLNANAFGYMGLPIDPTILLPKQLRFFIKGTAGSQVRIALVDKDGDTSQVVVPLNGSWMQLSIMLDDTARTKYALYFKSDKRLHDIDESPSPFIAVEDEDSDEYEGLFSDVSEASIFDDGLDGSFDYALTMKDPDEVARAVYLLSRASITSLSEIRFYWLTPSSTFWLDHVDCRMKQWQTEEINMNRVTYETVNDELIASAEFGDSARTATDELTDLWAVIRSTK